jgi:light-regulated signal transduction histidine kinase (bacteriophytochrome)
VRLLEHRFPEKLDAKLREYIAGAADGATRMEGLITDLLTFSRLSTGGRRFAPVELGAPLNAALHNLQFSIRAAKAVVTSDPMPTLPVDESQMVQLFQNLIANALKFRSERPLEIHIGARSEEGRWVFWVRDNGIGIEAQYFERIFQVFQRLHTRNKYPGTGIGLAICKKIVERHGGKIWVESQPDQGSTFFFSLPQPSA